MSKYLKREIKCVRIKTTLKSCTHEMTKLQTKSFCEKSFPFTSRSLAMHLYENVCIKIDIILRKIYEFPVQFQFTSAFKMNGEEKIHSQTHSSSTVRDRHFFGTGNDVNCTVYRIIFRWKNERNMSNCFICQKNRNCIEHKQHQIAVVHSIKQFIHTRMKFTLDTYI